MTSINRERPGPSPETLAAIDRIATAAAREAGALLMAHFGKPLRIDYKDKDGTDPVTQVDRNSQALLADRIRAAFPDHSIVGEEDNPSTDEELSDYVWVLDPLDGTRNFSQGLPIFACSVGVLHCGKPMAGAIFIPWPDTSGRVIHAVAGGSAYWDDAPAQTLATAAPESQRLIGVPGGFGSRYRFDSTLRRRAGEPRQIGSIAFEEVLVASGALQYSALTSSLSIWDVAAAAAIVPAAGGVVMIQDLNGGPSEWSRLVDLVPNWEEAPPGAAELKRWRRPMIFGAPGVAEAIAAGLRPRASWTRWIRRALP